MFGFHHSEEMTLRVLGGDCGGGGRDFVVLVRGLLVGIMQRRRLFGIGFGRWMGMISRFLLRMRGSPFVIGLFGMSGRDSLVEFIQIFLVGTVTQGTRSADTLF